MLESLARHASHRHDVTILAMDEAVPELIAKVGRPEWRVVHVGDLGDAEFTALKETRPHREFCWTAAPVLCNSLIARAKEGDFVVYLDADLMFYADPQVLLDELGQDGNVMIHEHRYSPDRKAWEAGSGRFNVGFVAFRLGDEARACAQRWRDQVIEKCVLDPDNGYCGDQGYLNEWPSLYPGVRIMSNIGGGTAPWNLASYAVAGTPTQPTVDGTPVVFFHYHAFRTAEVPPFGLLAAQPAAGYNFSRSANRLLFQRYAHAVRAASARLRSNGTKVPGDQTLSPKDALRGVLAGRYVLAFHV